MRMRSIALLLLLVSPAAALADECRAVSGAHTTALVELYTSEGCSSCPPADRWLSSVESPRSQQRFVPIAFHVNYWDYIGWKDAFADGRYTERQRSFARVTGARSVYTPQVVVGGRDFPHWAGERRVKDAIDAVNRKPARATLEVRSLARPGGGVIAVVSAEVLPGHDAKDLALVAALTQDGISSRVTAGENRGELLRHDFVARDVAERRGFDRAPRASASLPAEFKAQPGWDAARSSLVAFVQDMKSGEILQALATPLCR